MKPIPMALGLVIAVAVAGCGGSSGGAGTNPEHHYAGATAPSDAAGAVSEITSTWQTFFHTGTKPTAAAQLLENGDHLGPAIKAAARIQRKQKVSEAAKVLDVAFTSPTAATVTYKLLSHGQVLLPNATGQAVLQGGKWKVSQSTFCTLVQLGAGGATIPGC